MRKKYEEYKIQLSKIHVDNIFNKDYSLKKLSKEESLKFKIDFKEISKNIILDYTPIIYYDDKEKKIKCIYQEINYNTDIYLYDYYKYAQINILSNLNYNTNIEIESSKLDSIKLIKNQFKSNSISKIQIIPMKKDNVENKIVSYDFNLILKQLSTKVFDIKCLINISFSKLYILLSCEEYELIYDEKQKIFMFKDMKSLFENEEINIKCISKIEGVNILPKICLTSDKEDNNVPKPDIRITNNNILFTIKSSNEKTSILHFISEIYFTNEFSVRILFNTQVKKRDYKFLCYDYNKNNFVNESPFLYLNEYILRENNEIIYDQYLLLINESNKRNSYKIKIINEFKGVSLLNNENELNGIVDKEKIIKLSFKINKDFIPLLKANCQIGIELNINNIIKRNYIEISSYLIEEQIIKTCYLINPENKIIELNNVPYSELKDKPILLYNGFMKNLYCEIDYKEYKILNLSDKPISNSTFCFDPLSNRVEAGSLENYNFKDKKQRIKIFLYGIINNSFEWFPLAHNFKSIFLDWYRIYKNGDFENKIQFIIGNYRNEYNSIEKNNISFSNIIYIIKNIKSNKIKDVFENLLKYLNNDVKENLKNQLEKLIVLENNVNGQGGQDELDKNKILLIFNIYELFSTKYKILQNNNFKINLNGSINEVLKEYMIKSYNKYFSIDEEIIKKYLQKEKEIKEEKKKNKYLICQNEQPILNISVNAIKDNPQYFNNINESTEE